MGLTSIAIGLPLVLKKDEMKEAAPKERSFPFSWRKDRWRLFALLSLLPCILLLLPVWLVLPEDRMHPFTPLIWPGLDVCVGVFIAIVSQRISDWPSKAF